MNSARVARNGRGVLRAASWLISAAVAASASVAFAQSSSIPGLVVTTTPSREPVAPVRPESAPPKAEAKPKPAPRPRREASTAPVSGDEGSGGGGGSGRGQGIVLLVNDEPVTGYEIEQRATLMAASSGGGGGDMRARAEARWKQIIQDPKINERFQNFLRDKQPKTREEAAALQKQFVGDLQKNMIEGLRREQRVGSIQKFRAQAREELIDEKLKIQEGKRQSIIVTDAEVDRAFKEMSERNKVGEAQFIAQLKSQGIDPGTIKARTKAALVWRDVLRRKYGAQININDRDVERFIEQAGVDGSAGTPQVEMQLHRITLAVPGRIDQAALARRLAEAEDLRKRFRGCRNTQELVNGVADARFESLANQAATSVAEPTRSLLLNAKDGEMAPPTLASTGVELYAVCGRKTVKVDEEKRLKATQELTQREFEVASRRHLRDLRAEALIEKR